MSTRPSRYVKPGLSGSFSARKGTARPGWPAPEKLSGLAEAHFGDVTIALAPARDQVALVDTASSDAVSSQLRWAIDAYHQEPRRLSPVPYLVTLAGIRLWEPSPDHPAYVLIQEAQRLLARFEYEQQGQVLQDLLNRSGEDVYVAQYDIARRPDGFVWSWATWAKQVPTGLLPEVDLLAVGDLDDKTRNFFVSWDDVMRLAPKALRPEPGCDPPRWRHNSWPSEAIMKRLRAKGVTPGQRS